MTERHALWMVLSLTLAACAGGDGATPGETGPGLAIEVAPLSLPDVTDAEYTIVVSTAAGEVWRKTVTSRRYGDGGGAISYVGPCDGAGGAHTVTLTVDKLYGGAEGTTELSDWVDPGPLVKSGVVCAPNADTAVSFEITLMRSAQRL